MIGDEPKTCPVLPVPCCIAKFYYLTCHGVVLRVVIRGLLTIAAAIPGFDTRREQGLNALYSGYSNRGFGWCSSSSFTALLLAGLMILYPSQTIACAVTLVRLCSMLHWCDDDRKRKDPEDHLVPSGPTNTNRASAQARTTAIPDPEAWKS